MACIRARTPAHTPARTPARAPARRVPDRRVLAPLVHQVCSLSYSRAVAERVRC